jgi:hypothetical protein
LKAVDRGHDPGELLTVAKLAAPDARGQLVAEKVIVGTLAGDVVSGVGLEPRGVDARIDQQADAAGGGIVDDLGGVLEQGERTSLLVAVKTGRDEDSLGAGQPQPHQVELAASFDDGSIPEGLGGRGNGRVPAGHVIAEQHSPECCHVCRRRARRIGSATHG